MAEPLQAVKGMNDILPPESARWEWLEDQVRALMRRYGYQNIRTPIVEPTPLFVRGLGEVTEAAMGWSAVTTAEPAKFAGRAAMPDVQNSAYPLTGTVALCCAAKAPFSPWKSTATPSGAAWS